MTTKKSDESKEKAAPAAASAKRKAPKERTFVDAKTGKSIASPKQGGTGKATQALREQMHEQRNGRALPLRIGAGVLWALGLMCEVLAILVGNGTLYIPAFSAAVWLVVLIVADLALVVVGSQLWKRANHIAPASAENKAAYWVQTQLGVIVAAIAFAPIIILLLTNKDLDKNTKKVGSIVAAVALVVACASGVDWNPVTQEELDEAEAGAAVLSDDGLAYWTQFGKVYHFNPDCQYIRNSSTIYAGSLQDAIDAKRSEGCSACTQEDGTDLLSDADPDAVAAAIANAIAVGDDVDSASDAGDDADDAAADDDAAESAEDEDLPMAA